MTLPVWPFGRIKETQTRQLSGIARSMSLNDIILFLVVFGSMAIAICFPGLGTAFQPYLMLLMMCLLFLSFLKIRFLEILDTSKASLWWLSKLVIVKLVLLPAGLYALCWLVAPEYAIPVLLLSGISTGVVAPFLGSLMGAHIPPVIRMVIATSLVAPFSLPYLVWLLASQEISIPLGTMIYLLAVVIFVPMTAVQLIRWVRPGILQWMDAHRFPISMLLFGLINLGVFSKYSSFFFEEPAQVLLCVIVAYGLYVIYYGIGFVLGPRDDDPRRLATAVSLALMNNVLVIVFASRFFGPLAPTLAAMYMFPYYTMIVPVRLLANRSKSISSREPGAR
jgi:bile acid:Na+ symporter, BASS family